MQNTSGQGALAAIPPEIDKWNWGAFLLNWIWGIGNNTLIALLMFVPVANVIMLFMLGFKGSEWAWRNKKWESVEHFRAVQRKWAQAALIAYALMVALLAAIIFAVFSAMKSSEAYKLAAARLESHQQAAELLGTPISTGFPSGNIRVSGPSGEASLSFSVEGSKNKGTVFIEAVKKSGRWEATRLELLIDGSDQRIDLNSSTSKAPV